jgi:hypothetical protein
MYKQFFWAKTIEIHAKINIFQALILLLKSIQVTQNGELLSRMRGRNTVHFFNQTLRVQELRLILHRAGTKRLTRQKPPS